MGYADALKGYLIEEKNGSYRYTIVKRGQPVHFSRNGYSTHYAAERAAVRYQASKAA